MEVIKTGVESFSKASKGLRLTIKDEKYRIWMDSTRGKKLLDSIELAKGYAFDLIENAKAETYLFKQSLRKIVIE